MREVADLCERTEELRGVFAQVRVPLVGLEPRRQTLWRGSKQTATVRQESRQGSATHPHMRGRAYLVEKRIVLLEHRLVSWVLWRRRRLGRSGSHKCPELRN